MKRTAIMDEKQLLKKIEENPQIMLGKPVVRGTRLPVQIVLEKLAAGSSQEDITRDYPFLTHDDIRACVLYAAKRLALEHDETIEL